MDNTKDSLNRRKVEYLESLGATVTDHAIEDTKHTSAYVSFISDLDYTIDLDDFCLGDSLEDICRWADAISCCGDVLDRDHMMCPTCQEHC